MDSDRNVCRLSFVGSVTLGAALLVRARNERIVVGCCTGLIVLAAGIDAVPVIGRTSVQTRIEAQTIGLVLAIAQLKTARLTNAGRAGIVGRL
jgi:hypothetical protein